jgi:hypothetical protein
MGRVLMRRIRQGGAQDVSMLLQKVQESHDRLTHMQSVRLYT